MKITRRTETGQRLDAGPSPRPYDRAQEAAIEKAITPYILMECDHYTTWQEDEATSCWRPKGSKRFWCDKCNKWQKRKPKPKPPELTEPLF